jgi:type VI secretion system protein ImpA
MPQIDQLVRPLSADQPSGVDLSLSPEFDAIAELRREDDATLAQGEWVTELKTADWPGAAAACERLLLERTQDLRVAGWWTEASTHTRGLRGLADGLALCSALLREQWDTLHPQPEGGDLDERVGALNWLLMRIGPWTQQAPLLTLNRRRIALRDVEAARQRQRDGTPTPDGQATLETIQRGFAQAGNAAFDDLLAAALAAETGLRALQVEADPRFGDEGPAFSAAYKALESAVMALRRIGRDSGLGGSTGPAAAPPDDAKLHHGTEPAPATSSAPGVLQSRAQAVQQLRDVAAYFRRTEPHSPVAYLAEKAARWGDLPLHAWLRQVLKDEGALSRLDELLGLEPPQGGGDH